MAGSRPKRWSLRQKWEFQFRLRPLRQKIRCRDRRHSLPVIPTAIDGSRDNLKASRWDSSTTVGILLQCVDLIDQAFAEIGAEQNFIRSNLDRLSAWFREILLRKRF